MIDKKFVIAAVLLAVIVASGCLLSKPTERATTTSTASPTASPITTAEPVLTPIEESTTATGGEEVPDLQSGAPSGENLDLGSLV